MAATPYTWAQTFHVTATPTLPRSLIYVIFLFLLTFKFSTPGLLCNCMLFWGAEDLSGRQTLVKESPNATMMSTGRKGTWYYEGTMNPGFKVKGWCMLKHCSSFSKDLKGRSRVTGKRGDRRVPGRRKRCAKPNGPDASYYCCKTNHFWM